MKRAAPHDAGGDDSSDRRHIPRVIRNALERRHPRAAGYGPAVPVQMALAHRWARYDDVVAALRSLGNLSLLEQPARDDARATVRGLFQHPTPFDAGARFPEAEVFLLVDHGKFGQCVSRIQKELLRVEAATRGYNWQRVIAACEAFMEAVSSAAATATLVWPEEPGKPVLYDRAVFEEAFQITWTDA
ncbi:unnamed protein product [Urochloa decumbens]|uniref:Uncharacterized protein n=1 Tax=Urochloa decumbens TaxID=240449 RepID=A0ABC9CDD3_9POAL